MSAGEPLPAALYQRWTEHFGVDILDGIGMTEMLHIFLSNRAGAVRPGTTGVAVPGYDLRILDEDGGRGRSPGRPAPVRARRVDRHRLLVAATTRRARCSRASGCAPATPTSRTPTATTPASAAPTTCSRRAASGCRRARSRPGCCEHPAVAQAVVVAAVDADGLEKPVAYVVRPLERRPCGAEAELIEFCREGLPSFKRPRRVFFVDALPTTATGKIRRVELRAAAAGVLGRRTPEACSARTRG